MMKDVELIAEAKAIQGLTPNARLQAFCKAVIRRVEALTKVEGRKRSYMADYMKKYRRKHGRPDRGQGKTKNRRGGSRRGS